MLVTCFHAATQRSTKCAAEMSSSPVLAVPVHASSLQACTAPCTLQVLFQSGQLPCLVFLCRLATSQM